MCGVSVNNTRYFISKYPTTASMVSEICRNESAEVAVYNYKIVENVLRSNTALNCIKYNHLFTSTKVMKRSDPEQLKVFDNFLKGTRPMTNFEEKAKFHVICERSLKNFQNRDEDTNLKQSKINSTSKFLKESDIGIILIMSILAIVLGIVCAVKPIRVSSI